MAYVMGADEPTLDQLKARGRGLTFHVLEMVPTAAWGHATPEQRAETLHAHLRWQQELERRGVLVLAGPLDPDVTPGTGMSVLRASREEAEALAVEEPFHQAGLRHNRVRRWVVNEGCVTVTVRLFDDSGELH